MINVKILEQLKLIERNLLWLSEKAGLSYSALHKLANNKTNSISFDTLYKVCIVLNCDISDILEINRTNSTKTLD